MPFQVVFGATSRPLRGKGKARGGGGVGRREGGESAYGAESHCRAMEDESAPSGASEAAA